MGGSLWTSLLLSDTWTGQKRAESIPGHSFFNYFPPKANISLAYCLGILLRRVSVWLAVKLRLGGREGAQDMIKPTFFPLNRLSYSFLITVSLFLKPLQGEPANCPGDEIRVFRPPHSGTFSSRAMGEPWPVGDVDTTRPPPGQPSPFFYKMLVHSLSDSSTWGLVTSYHLPISNSSNYCFLPDNLQTKFLVTEFPTGSEKLALCIRIFSPHVMRLGLQFRGFLGGLEKIQTECSCESSWKTQNKERSFSAHGLQGHGSWCCSRCFSASSLHRWVLPSPPRYVVTCWEAYSFPGPRS